MPVVPLAAPAPAQRDRRAQGQQAQRAQQGGQAPLEPPGGEKWMETMETLPKPVQNEGFTMFHHVSPCFTMFHHVSPGGFNDLIL